MLLLLGEGWAGDGDGFSIKKTEGEETKRLLSIYCVLLTDPAIKPTIQEFFYSGYRW